MGAGKHESLPRVICSSVVRAADKGESHGGLYLVDLDVGAVEQVMDWNTSEISFEGRGGERGLRGIDFYGDAVIVATHNEIFFIDRNFHVLQSLKNRYLDDCHELCVSGDLLYVTSTRYDSVLVCDLKTNRFVKGYNLRRNALNNLAKKFDKTHLSPAGPLGLPGLATGCSVMEFDPESDAGPRRRDTVHVNMVMEVDGKVYVAGTRTNFLYAIADGEISAYGRVRLGSHNARPWNDGTLYCDTWNNALVAARRSGRVALRCPVVDYDESTLETRARGAEYARQGWMRGLCIWNGQLIAGSSPATVSVYDSDDGSLVRSVNLSMDVRNAVHGLEIYPF